jgi:nuclear transport factor 2 (NTF2) superfamily protein
MPDRPPVPPFTRETALQKVQAAEDAWNTTDPERVAGAYTTDSVWRNRDTFVT